MVRILPAVHIFSQKLVVAFTKKLVDASHLRLRGNSQSVKSQAYRTTTKYTCKQSRASYAYYLNHSKFRAPKLLTRFNTQRDRETIFLLLLSLSDKKLKMCSMSGLEFQIVLHWFKKNSLEVPT